MLYLGIDIGKQKHVAALLSPALLDRYTRFDACPTLSIDNARAGFEQLLSALRVHADPQETHVLLERTGHYGASLEAYLTDAGCHLYRMAARARYANNKTDRSDARALVVLLYNAVELHAPVVDEKMRITPVKASSPTSRTLRGYVYHRDELMSESTQRKNKLTAILDELFPEFVQVYKDPFSESALLLREQFPTPALIAAADLDALCVTRKRHIPRRDDLARLQAIAATTIGTRDQSRHVSLLLEQRLLIAELRLMSAHVEMLDAEIERLVSASRAGVILRSFPGVGDVQAGKLLAGINSISNFETVSALRAYMGWSPRSVQTGTSMDSSNLSKGGNPLLKKTMYLVAMTAIHYDPFWKAQYSSMVARKCNYDGRRKEYVGKMKVVGHIIGQLISVMYTLLRKDHDLLTRLPPGAEPPPPECYDANKFRIGREGAGKRPH